MNTYILLKEVKFYAFHGVNPQENITGATFIINMKLRTDFSQAMKTDELAGTVSYADIYQMVKEEMNQPSKLLEHVGGRIIRRIFDEFINIDYIELELIKQNPPMGADCQGAGISIYAER